MAPTKALLAALVHFAVVAGAFYTVLVHLSASEGDKRLEASCPPSVMKEFTSNYGSGVQGLDSLMCGLVNFFRASLEPSLKDFTAIFLYFGPAVVFVNLLEQSRLDRPLVAHPALALLWGFITQLFTGAMAFSLFWALFVVQAVWNNGKARKPVTRAGSEAAILATLFGYLAPTLWMMTTQSTWSIIAWQPFPVWVAIVYNIWMFYRRNDLAKQKAGSGSDLSQLGHLIFAFIGTVTWMGLLWPKVSKDALFELLQWLPSWSIPDPSVTTLRSAVLHLLQFDMFWMYISTSLAGIFLMDNLQDAFFIVQTAPALVAICGPAAMISGMWIVREYKLTVEEEEKEMKKAKKQ